MINVDTRQEIMYSKVLGDESPEELKNTMSHVRKKMNEHFREYKRLKQIYENIRDRIQRTCDHNWEIDREYFGHRTCYECTKCEAYRS